MLALSSTASRKRVAIAVFSAVAIVATVTLCLAPASITSSLASFSDLHFSYHAVDEWPGECKSGKGQMPVDIDTVNAVFMESSPLQWSTVLSDSILAKLQPEDADLATAARHGPTILFNGHTVQVSPDTSIFVEHEGKNYQLLQFHFHTPSENRMDGHSSASEMHMVHKASDGSLMVFAVLLDLDHTELQSASATTPSQSHDHHDGGMSPLFPVFEALPVLRRHIAHHNLEHPAGQHSQHTSAEKPPAHTAVEIPLLGFSFTHLVDYLVKEDFASNYFYLPGSLTTPPCTEGVHWIISAKRLSIPVSALADLLEMEGENSRVLQSYNTRVMHKNFK